MAMALQLAARRPRVSCRKAEKRNGAVARSTATRRSQEGEVASAGPWTSASATCQVSSACSCSQCASSRCYTCAADRIPCAAPRCSPSPPGWRARRRAGRIHTPQPRRWVTPRGAERMASGLVR
jgi:hypothetical protein